MAPGRIRRGSGATAPGGGFYVITNISDRYVRTERTLSTEPDFGFAKGRLPFEDGGLLVYSYIMLTMVDVTLLDSNPEYDDRGRIRGDVEPRPFSWQGGSGRHFVVRNLHIDWTYIVQSD